MGLFVCLFVCNVSIKVVLRANKLAKAVRKRKSMQNWLIYYEMESIINPDKRTGLRGLFKLPAIAAQECRDAINLNLSVQEAYQRYKLADPDASCNSAFVTFTSSDAACSFLQKSFDASRNMLSVQAPEPEDIYWENMERSNLNLILSRVGMCVVQLAFIVGSGKNSIQRTLTEYHLAYIPGLLLKGFMLVISLLPETMAKLEGRRSYSSIDRHAAQKLYIFFVLNIFVGLIMSGQSDVWLIDFLSMPPQRILKQVCKFILSRAGAFISLVLVDACVGLIMMPLRLWPLFLWVVRSAFQVKTQLDREKAVERDFFNFGSLEAQGQLYFLIAASYSVINPAILPFAVVFSLLGDLVHVHQMLKVQEKRYESLAAFWPQAFDRLIFSMCLAPIILIGVLVDKTIPKVHYAITSLVVLIGTIICFRIFCKRHFRPSTERIPVGAFAPPDTEEARALFNNSLIDAYMHPDVRAYQQMRQFHQQVGQEGGQHEEGDMEAGQEGGEI